MAKPVRARQSQPTSFVFFLPLIFTVRFFRINIILSFIISLAFIALARAEEAGEPQLPNSGFRAKPSNDWKVLADIKSMIKPFDFEAWRARGEQIRSGLNRGQCYGNLSLALSEIGNLYQVGSAGASGALSLLPTAGALVGAPEKELLVLYKLVPVADFLSMLLSLGGNIVPQNIGDYAEDSFSYGTDGKDLGIYEQALDMNSPDTKGFADVSASAPRTLMDLARSSWQQSASFHSSFGL